MKKIGLYLTIIAAGLMITGNINAKIWRVNNNPGKSCNFTNLTDALRSLKKGGTDNIAEGDTIHIEGSTIVYGKATQTLTNCDTVYKKVVIIGPGYQLSDNSETQHNKESAKIKTLFIAKEAAGTIIAGVEQSAPGTYDDKNVFTANTYLRPATYEIATVRISTTNVESGAAYLWGDNPAAYKLRIAADNVTVTHSKLFYVDLYNTTPLTNITITKCMFNPGLIACAGSQAVTNLIISNNFFRNEYYRGALATNDWYKYLFRFVVIDCRVPGNTAATNTQDQWNNYTWAVVNPTIQNNTFYRAACLAVRAGRLYNNIFFLSYPSSSGYGAHLFGLPVWLGVAEHDARNNIIYNGTYWSNPTAYTTNHQYSSSYGNILPNINGNQYSNLAETSWFRSSTTLPALDKSFVLSSGNGPAGNPDETSQRGMFGGLSPYVLSGLYTIPAVWSISIPNYPSGEVPSTGFEVQVKVKSH